MSSQRKVESIGDKLIINLKYSAAHDDENSNGSIEVEDEDDFVVNKGSSGAHPKKDYSSKRASSKEKRSDEKRKKSKSFYDSSDKKPDVEDRRNTKKNSSKRSPSVDDNDSRFRYDDSRTNKKKKRSASRSPVRLDSGKRNDSRQSRYNEEFKRNRENSPDRDVRSRRSRSRSPFSKKFDRFTKIKGEEDPKPNPKRDRHSPHTKTSSKSRRLSPSPVRRKNRKRSVSPACPKSPSPPRSPSPPASPSPPRSPSPENDHEDEAPASPSNSSTRSDDARRHKSNSHKKRQKKDRDTEKKHDRRGRRRSGDYDEDLPFDDDGANGHGSEDEKYPDIGEIYEAVVAAIKPFGFFALLMGLRHKYYGLVHISEMKRDGYVTNVEELVQLGQTVYVKVISSQPKIALSLKDVDQETGEDLDVKRTLKLLEDPEFLDKEKNVRQNRSNGMVVSGLGFSDESEYRDLIANLLINEMNLPGSAEHIGYCQPVQGIEFRKKGSTTQLVKIRFYEDDSVPYNRDDVLSRYMTLRNTNLWRHKEIVLNPELRTMGPPRPKIKESLLGPGDFLPEAPAEEMAEDNEDGSALQAESTGAESGVAQNEDTSGPMFVPLPQLGANADDDDDDDELQLPKRPVQSSGSKPFSQEMMSQIVTRVKASLNTILKPTTRFELPRTFTSMPPPPPVTSTSAASIPVSVAAPTASTASATSSSVSGTYMKQPVFHPTPPPPVNLPSAVNVNVPPPKLTINIGGIPQRPPPSVASGTGAATNNLQQQQARGSSDGLSNQAPMVQYPASQQYAHLQQQQQQQQQSQQQSGAQYPHPGQPTVGMQMPSHLAALQQQLQRFATQQPPPLGRPGAGPLGAAAAALAGPSAPGSTGNRLGAPTYPFNLPPLLGPGNTSSPQQQRPGLGPYTNSQQAQQHLQQLLSSLAGGRPPISLPSGLFGPRGGASDTSSIPPLFGPSHQQQPSSHQHHQQQQQQQQHSGSSHQQTTWQHNPYAMPTSMQPSKSSTTASSLTSHSSSGVSSASKTSSSSTGSGGTASKSESKGESSTGSAPNSTEITQLLSLAKKLGFNIKTSNASE